MIIPGSHIAVIGAGAAGLTAAYLLQSRYHITVFEQDSRCGGHAQTLSLDHGPDAGLSLDIGFMVLNDRNYPTLHRLLEKLGGIEIGVSEMSFGYYAESDGFHYALNWTPENVFTQRTNRQKPPTPQPTPNRALLNLLKDVMQFCRQFRDDLQADRLDGLTLEQYLTAQQFSTALINRYILPMGAAIWSTPTRKMLQFPAQTFAQFFEQHGLLSLQDVPQWQYIQGGSHRYVNRLLASIQDRVEQTCPVLAVSRHDDHVTVTTSHGGSHQFDAVVMATHADEALRLLTDPSETEQQLLRTWHYQKNHAVLHTDTSVMPPDIQSWASWNYTQESAADESTSLCVSYHLNRLQNHVNTAQQYFLTLNRVKAVAASQVLAEVAFTHPTYTFEALDSQVGLRRLNGLSQTFYCGSYLGYGFHEDAVKSGVDVARALGCQW